MAATTGTAGAAGGVPATVFALNPSKAVTDLYDYTTTKDAKLYASATAALATKHDGTVTTLRIMLDELALRSDEFGWGNLLLITDSNDVQQHLITSNRMLKLEDVIRATTNYVDRSNRMAQDNHMMVTCILNSLTSKGAQALRDSQYSYLQGTTPSAPMLIKVLLLDCEVENASTNFFIRERMTQLEDKIKALDYDVLTFNKHVQDLQRKLKQGGEESSDLFMHVMRAYLQCKDRDFVQDIKEHKRKFERGELTLDLKTLMIAAQRSYQTLLQEGTYNKPSTEEEQILALTARLEGNKKKDGGHPVAAWKLVAPVDGKNTKTVSGKEWLYCETHKKWGQHKLEDCFLKKKRDGTGTGQGSSGPAPGPVPVTRAPTATPPPVTGTVAGSSTGSTQRLTMSAAMAALLDEDDDGYVSYPSLLSYGTYTTAMGELSDPPKEVCDIIPATTFADPCSKNNGNIAFVATFDSDSFKILVDNGASRCMTNNRKHFIGTPRIVCKQVRGLGKGDIKLEGTVRWNWLDDTGKAHEIDIPNTLFCPALPFCLLSPQHLAREVNDHHPSPNGTWLATYSDHMILFWAQQQAQRTIPLTTNSSGVGFLWSAPGFRRSDKFLSMAAMALPDNPICFPAKLRPSNSLDSDDEAWLDDGIWATPEDKVTYRDEPFLFEFAPGSLLPPGGNAKGMDSVPYTTYSDGELANPQHELLRLHHKLAHLPFAQLQAMARIHVIPNRLAKCTVPKCSACLFGKATKRAWRDKGPVSSLVPSTSPGQCVSVDQLESSTMGLVAQVKGTPTTQRYNSVTVFVDHHTRFTFVYVQPSTDATHTVLAKEAFELFARNVGVMIQHYHGDNGRFAENLFMSHARKLGQRVTHCGVNAHFQNGIAERRIRDLQDRGRTMLVHAKHHWPDAIEPCLWPFAIRLANEAHNCTPIRDGLSPIALFSRSRVLPNINHLHPFGCPVYVLNERMQSDKKGPKWDERARCGIYLGLSPNHARSVSLVLSLTTGMVSAQFHIHADEFFETVTHQDSGTPVLSMPYPSKWQQRLGFPSSTFSPPILRHAGRREGAAASDNVTEGAPPESSTQEKDDANTASEGDSEGGDDWHSVASSDAVSDDGDDDVFDEAREFGTPQVQARPVRPPEGVPAGQQQGQGPDPIRRSARTGTAPRRLIEDAAFAAHKVDVLDAYYDIAEYQIQQDMADPIGFAATADPDTMYLHEAQREPDWPKFQTAMLEEVLAHETNGHWELIDRKDIPSGVPVLPSVWSMKRKRRIDTREVYKWKARLTVHGGKQTQGVNFWETYAPVVNWTSIRLYLILSVLNNFHTRQIDFVLAYPQADVECEMYMEIPRGFEYAGSRKTHALKLIKNIYGTRQAGRVWNQHIHNGLLERGYVQSTVDHCVYYHGTTVFLLYVDDGIFAGPDANAIDALIKSLQSDPACTTQYNITDEGTLDDYLGVKIQQTVDGRFTLTQPHLIQQILDDMGFKENSKTKKTPALTSKILQRDISGDTFQETWLYRSVVGKLNFLEKSTRGDISYPVHQCARFCSDPRGSHGEAIKRIGRYLMGTKDKGVIIDPNHNSFECYVDADFCGNWDQDTAEDDPTTAKSRTGYVIKYAGCPIVWQSKLQTEVALSTTEAEYIALSTALRDVTSLMYLLEEATAQGIPNIATVAQVHCRIFEDNSGALELARVPKMRPRTKHLNVKYHHFREHVRKGLVTIHPISTLDQQADLYTKPLAQEPFEKFRRAIFGW